LGQSAAAVLIFIPPLLMLNVQVQIVPDMRTLSDSPGQSLTPDLLVNVVFKRQHLNRPDVPVRGITQAQTVSFAGH
jgi:hypothetical protein